MVKKCLCDVLLLVFSNSHYIYFHFVILLFWVIYAVVVVSRLHTVLYITIETCP